MRVIHLILAVLFVLSSAVGSIGARDIPTMTVAELKSRLDDRNLVIIDVRAPQAWRLAREKIKGAHREDPLDTDSWIGKYPKEKTYVFYCS